MHVPLYVLIGSWALVAQPPRPLDEAFFAGDRKTVLRELTERARALNPDEVKYLPEYARGYLGVLNRAKAEEMLKKAEQQEPNDGEILRLIAMAWLKGGFKAEAMAAYERILQRDPKNKDALLQAATDLAEVGLAPEAEKYMKAYEAREKGDWKAFCRFGRAYLMGGHRKLAAPWFAKALALRQGKDDVLMDILGAYVDTQSVF